MNLNWYVGDELFSESDNDFDNELNVEGREHYVDVGYGDFVLQIDLSL